MIRGAQLSKGSLSVSTEFMLKEIKNIYQQTKRCTLLMMRKRIKSPFSLELRLVLTQPLPLQF